jgi:superoxide dismutase, Fe-Mn family
MKTLTTTELSENIKRSLGIDPKRENRLLESYVAQEKTFNLPTEFLSEANKANHFELYRGYIESFNRVSAELDTANRSEVNSNSNSYRSLKIDETYNMNGAYLHELYFANISDLHSEVSMDSLSYMRLSRDFGGFDAWQNDFIACCQASRCGWAITYYNIWTKSFMNTLVDLHSENVPVGGIPVIVMDVWQHAYYKDYLKDVKTYTYAMMKQLNWNVIESRILKADRVGKVLQAG